MGLDSFYNGFTSAERRAANRIIRVALANGVMSFAHRCAICDCALPRPHQFHLEQYRDPMSAYPVCRRCHYAVHIRFRHPGCWARLLASLPTDGWFRQLSLDPASLRMPYERTYPMGLGTGG